MDWVKFGLQVLGVGIISYILVVIWMCLLFDGLSGIVSGIGKGKSK